MWSAICNCVVHISASDLIYGFGELNKSTLYMVIVQGLESDMLFGSAPGGLLDLVDGILVGYCIRCSK